MCITWVNFFFYFGTYYQYIHKYEKNLKVRDQTLIRKLMNVQKSTNKNFHFGSNMSRSDRNQIKF